MAGIFTNPYTTMQALGNQGQAAAAQNQQYQIMSNLLSSYLGSAMNPQNLASGVAAQTQPLSTGAVENIQNQVGGSIAERGLSESFPQWQYAMGQAMANPLMQMQNQGVNQYLSGQQLPFMVPHPSVSMPTVPQQQSTLASGILGAGIGSALGGAL